MVRTAAPGLLTPITIKGRTLGNRIVMPPMASHLSPPDGSVTQEHLDRYVPWQPSADRWSSTVTWWLAAASATTSSGIHDDALIDGHARL